MTSPNQQHNNEAPLRIARRVAWAIASQYVNTRDGYNKLGWRQGLKKAMSAQEPVAAQVIRDSAEDAVYADIIEDAIHHFKPGDSEVPEAAKTQRAIAKFRRFVKQSEILVSVPIDGRRVDVKRYRDCSPAELDAAAVLCEHKAAPYQRQAKFLHASATQGRLAGLGENDPLSKLLAA